MVKFIHQECQVAYYLFQYIPEDTNKFMSSLTAVVAIGWILAAIAILQIPCWGIYVVYKQKSTIMDAQMLGLSNINSSSSWARLEKRRKYLVDVSCITKFKIPSVTITTFTFEIVSEILD